MSLTYIGQQYTIYAGLFLLITGIIGNSANILIFSTVRTYRTNPCSFYFLINSMSNTVYICINLISRIVTTGYGIDLTRTSLAWCKIRGYTFVALSLISFTCSCLATIDQFLVTSRSVYLRSLSNIKLAHRIVFVVIVICCLHAVPTLFYFNISSITQTCVNTNNVYSIYRSIYGISLTCFIPIVIMIIFAYLTYRNIHCIRALVELQADRQLTRTTLIQVIVVVISNTPSGINSMYSLITSGYNKDPDRVSRESFATTIVGLLIYIYYAGSSYTFLIVSSRFRRAIRDRILFWRKPNQIVPARLPRRGSATLKSTAIN